MANVSHISDRTFFGEWDASLGTWKKEGKLNYTYSENLSPVEELVKKGDYNGAKKALLKYYRNRTNIPRAGFEWGGNSEHLYLNNQDVYSFQEPYMTRFTVENSGEYKEYKIDLGGTRESVYLLSSFDKTEDMVMIASRESELSPSLEIIRKDGTSVSLLPIRDTYIRGCDESADYSKENYGTAKELYIKDSWCTLSNGTNKPYSSRSRRTYIAFDSGEFPLDLEKVYLKLYARIVPEEGNDTVTENSHEIHIFSAYNKSWAEHGDEVSSFAPMTWAQFRIAHYSWKGMPGGFDWARPDNCPSEYITFNTRFIGQASLAIEGVKTGDRRYTERSIEQLLDFIHDTNGMIETVNIPPNRDIESAERCCKFPGMFAAYLDYEGFTADAMTDILKWLWEEMTYLYNGAGILYKGNTAEATPNNYAETNRGLWHVKGTEGICTYFPEYADRNEWKRVANDRLNTVAHVLINEDGCYQEATFSYAAGMVGYLLSIYKYLQHSGDPIPAWFHDRLHNFILYIMYCSYPDHKTADFGEGGAPHTVGALKAFLSLVNDEEVRYVATDGAQGVKPAVTARGFKQLKVASCRTGWENDASMIFMTAKNGANHNHKDSLMFTFFAGDKELLADTGMTSYDGLHPHFNWQRHLTRSHNTVEIDGKPQRGSNFLYNYNPQQPNGEASLVIYPGAAIDRIEAWTDATEGFRHYRNVSYVKRGNFIIVSDMIRPLDGNTDEHSCTQNWHTYAPLPSNPVIDNKAKVGKTAYEVGSNLYIAQADTEGLDLTLEEGYSSTSPAPTKYFCYTKKGVGDVVYNTVLYPFYDGKEPSISIRNIDVGATRSEASATELSLPEKGCKVLSYNTFDSAATERSFGGYTVNAVRAVAIFDGENTVPSVISVCGGSLISVGGETLLSSDRVLKDVEIAVDGDKAVITSSDAFIDSARIAFKTPCAVTSVTVNGKEAAFKYSDKTVYLG